MGIDENRIHLITAGREPFKSQRSFSDFKNIFNEENSFLSRKQTALFMGWPKRVRGIDLLLDAVAIAAGQNSKLCIKILARGEATEDHRRLHR